MMHFYLTSSIVVDLCIIDENFCARCLWKYGLFSGLFLVFVLIDIIVCCDWPMICVVKLGRFPLM